MISRTELQEVKQHDVVLMDIAAPINPPTGLLRLAPQFTWRVELGTDTLTLVQQVHPEHQEDQPADPHTSRLVFERGGCGRVARPQRLFDNPLGALDLLARTVVVTAFEGHARQHQVGYATSGTWSPILKKNIALATIQTGYHEAGTELQFEMTVEHTRHTVTATVHKPAH